MSRIVQVIKALLGAVAILLVAFLLTVFVMEYTALFLLLVVVGLALVWWLCWFPRFYE